MITLSRQETQKAGKIGVLLFYRPAEANEKHEISVQGDSWTLFDCQ
jgi:hypothetical protein